MSPSAERSRRIRWAVPAGAIAVVGGLVAASVVSKAQATPPLPPRTPAQLLAAVAGRTGPLPPLTGTVVETAALGLPALPGTGDPTSLQSLLTGSHTIRVWYAGPRRARLAIPGQLSETDVIRNGRDVWIWSSVRNTATHLVLPARSTREPAPGAGHSPLTPQQAASQILAAVGPSTRVGVASNVTVAGEPAYELVLAPKDGRSLVGQVRIAVDARHDVPLRVQVFSRASATPAFQTGFTSISFTQPAAANFTFRPPAGAKVVQRGLAAGHDAMARARAGALAKARAGALAKVGDRTVLAGRHGDVIGQGWLAVAVLPAAGEMGGNGTAVRPLNALFGASSRVHGDWGSGRLLRTKLVSALLTDDGRLLIGAVTPPVLYNAAARTANLAGQGGR